MSKKKLIKRTLLVRLDERIELAKERKCFSEVVFYNEVKYEIECITKEKTNINKLLKDSIAVFDEQLNTAWDINKNINAKLALANHTIDLALNPIQWDKAMHDAWHNNLPDTIKAFKELHKAAVDSLRKAK